MGKYDGLPGRPVTAELSEVEKDFIKRNYTKMRYKKLLSILNRTRSAAGLPLLSIGGLRYFQEHNGLTKNESSATYKPNKWY